MGQESSIHQFTFNRDYTRFKQLTVFKIFHFVAAAPGMSLVPYVASGSSLSLSGEKLGTCEGRGLLPSVAIDVCPGLARICHIVCQPGVGVGCDIHHHLGGGRLHHQRGLPEACSSPMVLVSSFGLFVDAMHLYLKISV